MHRRIITIIIAALAAAGMAADTADSLLGLRQACFDSFADANPQERVYLHFDNTSYYKGEHIWYSAYVVRDGDFAATPLSRILYVELLNPIGYPVETQKLVISDGRASGSFLLTDTINAGFYEVRAYTAWMLNFTPGDHHGWDRLTRRDMRDYYGYRLQEYLKGNAGVFSRVFPVFEAVDSGNYARKLIPRLPKATASLADPVKDRLMIDFYPEGGNLVRDVPTRIAFQVHNAEGRTLNVAGTLVRKGREIGTFRTQYAGRGMIAVTADSCDGDDGSMAHGLKLCVTYQGRDYSFALPKPQARGYVLNVFSSPGSLKVAVARNAGTPGRKLGVSVTCRGRTDCFDVADLRLSRRCDLIIDKRSLRTGVNIVTLFTDEGHVLAQRLVFVNNHDNDGLRLEVEADTAGVMAYDRVTVDCRLCDADGQPVEQQRTFSMAVTDGPSRDVTYAGDNALTYLLLSSEVKGFIPRPDYYFEDDTPERAAALDHLLMVQGWTRYDFERMMSGDDFRPLIEPERSLTFRGRVLSGRDNVNTRFWKPLKKKAWIMNELSVLRDSLYIYGGETKLGPDGSFCFYIPPFYGSGRMSLMLNKNSEAVIGEAKAGVVGHNFSPRSEMRPALLMDKHIEPLNAWSPLPKNYSYYETAALADPWDKDMFGSGFMALPKEAERYRTYDWKSQSYLLGDVVKTKKRNWSDFRNVKPVSVMDVNDMMTWLSNIFGDICMPGSLGTMRGGGMAGLYNADDLANEKFFNTISTYETTSEDKEEVMSFPSDRTTIYEPNDSHYSRLKELLYIFGLDGMNRTFYNAGETGGSRRYTMAEGDARYLPDGMEFFPVNENFRQLRLYADVDNRRLTYQPGRYREVVYPYNEQSSTNDETPLTSVFNFITDKHYPNSYRRPEFMGFRINFQGISQPDEFFHPDYSRMPLPEQTDYRRTVYWNPAVITDSTGCVRIEFSNNGFSRTFEVSAEGVTPEGQPIIMKK